MRVCDRGSAASCGLSFGPSEIFDSDSHNCCIELESTRRVRTSLVYVIATSQQRRPTILFLTGVAVTLCSSRGLARDCISFASPEYLSHCQTKVSVTCERISGVIGSVIAQDNNSCVIIVLLHLDSRMDGNNSSVIYATRIAATSSLRHRRHYLRL